MRKRIISALLALVLMASLVPAVYAAADEASTSANALYQLGLFSGTGKDAQGNPVFDLDRTPTRSEAVTMLVRLLGKADEAQSGAWDTPFTDVADWAKPYVGYAYANGLTSGTSATTFGGDEIITPAQYITLVLRALGYESGVDFQWETSYVLSEELGITLVGRYTSWDVFSIEKTESGGTSWTLRAFVRGDMAEISCSALFANIKGTEASLLERIMSTPDAGAHSHSYADYQVPHYGPVQVGTKEVLVGYKWIEYSQCIKCGAKAYTNEEALGHFDPESPLFSRDCWASRNMIYSEQVPIMEEQPVYETQWLESTIHVCTICGQQEP